MRLYFGFSWSVVHDFCFWNYVEGLGVPHEVTDAFTGVTRINNCIPKELIVEISTNDHYLFYIYPFQEELH